MPYNNIISRTGAAATVPEDVSNVLLTNLTSQSAALSMFRQTRMSTNQTRMPVLAALPTAYFVNGDTGLKQTTEVSWANQYINVEEIAAIVPIPENVLDDTSFDVWGTVRPLMEQAIGRTLDAAVFFGTNKPASWPEAIVPQAVTAGNVVARGTSTAAQGGLAGDVSKLFATVENDGYDVNGLVANTTYRGMLRDVRDVNGRPLLDQQTGIYGTTVQYPMRGLWPTGVSAAEVIAGDFTQAILATRQDITYKVLDQSVIQDNTGAIIYNLAQQDMVALRVVARFGYAVADTISYERARGDAAKYPFGVLRSPAA
jgi:HK97 family phage major capsid protein